MITYIPNKDIIKSRCSLPEREKEILNNIHIKIKNSNKNIEAYLHRYIHNFYINITYIFEDKGVFIITNDKLENEEKMLLKKYFNTYIKEKNGDYLFHFSNLKKNEIEIYQDLKKYLNSMDEANLDKVKILKEIAKEFKEISFYRYGFIDNEEGEKLLNFNKKQIELILKDESFKVKGTAGSGKSIVMLSKAIEKYKKCGHKNLIVVFNITARNMLRKKLFTLNDDLDKNNFDIVHYHGLEKEYGLNYDYDNIFIDEAQDFERAWFDKIETYLKSDGKKYLFGDEKQNIYNRSVENKNISSPIPGAWNILKTSYRMDGRSVDLALSFQREFFNKKYEIDEVVKKSNEKITLNFEEVEKDGDIEYKYFNSFEKFKDSNIIDYIKNIIVENQLVHKDTAIITTEIEKILPIIQAFGEDVNEKGIVTETNDDIEKIEMELEDLKNEEKKRRKINEIRRNRKLNFEPFGNFLIFSTVHSFKGMERDNIIFIFSGNNREQGKKMDEIIYTGITRAKKNLYLINIGLEKYNEFFFKNVKAKGFDI